MLFFSYIYAITQKVSFRNIYNLFFTFKLEKINNSNNLSDINSR